MWCGAFTTWIAYLTKLKMDPDTWTDCKLGYFLFYFFRHYSSSLLAVMCIEKFFALYFPLKAKSICTIKTAKWACLLTALIFGIYNLQLFIIFGKHTTITGISYCTWVRVPASYVTIYYHIESVLYSFGPFTIMVIANVAIIYKFMMAKWRNRQGSSTESTSQALSKAATKGTAMLITVSVTFIMLTGPSAISVAIKSSAHPIQKVVINIMQYLNHSINGILYCVIGSRFRKEVVKIVCCGNTDPNRLSTLSLSSHVTQITTSSNLSQTDSPI